MVYPLGTSSPELQLSKSDSDMASESSTCTLHQHLDMSYSDMASKPLTFTLRLRLSLRPRACAVQKREERGTPPYPGGTVAAAIA